MFNPVEVNDAPYNDNVDVVAYRYPINLKNYAQFKLIVDYLSISASFQMASTILMMTKEHTGLDSIGYAFEGKMTSYACFICTSNLQMMLKLLSQM